MELTDARAVFVAAWSQPHPDYRAGIEAIRQFHSGNPSLRDGQVRELISVLSDRDNRWIPQLFVAQLLSRYARIDRSLMAPLLQAAIEMPDPNANRDFLRPCLTAFGADEVIAWLVGAFSDADLVDRIGISNLLYWLDSYPLDVDELRRRRSLALPYKEWLRSHEIDSGELRNAILNAASSTDNLIELYHYRLALPDQREMFLGLPEDASELCECIAGNLEYEQLLYDRLGWQRPD